MLNVAIVGTFAVSLEDAIRRNLAIPCEVVVSDEATIISHLAEVDVLVTMALTREMTRACPRLRLIQVPGAGLDRIDRSAIPPRAVAGECPRTRERNCRIRHRGDGDVDPRVLSS